MTQERTTGRISSALPHGTNWRVASIPRLWECSLLTPRPPTKTAWLTPSGRNSVPVAGPSAVTPWTALLRLPPLRRPPRHPLPPLHRPQPRPQLQHLALKKAHRLCRLLLISRLRQKPPPLQPPRRQPPLLLGRVCRQPPSGSSSASASQTTTTPFAVPTAHTTAHISSASAHGTM